MYKTELYSNGILLNVGIGQNLFASVEACQGAFINKSLSNRSLGTDITEFFIVTTKMYFNQYGKFCVKYKKGTFAFHKSETFTAKFDHVMCLFEYVDYLKNL